VWKGGESMGKGIGRVRRTASDPMNTSLVRGRSRKRGAQRKEEPDQK